MIFGPLISFRMMQVAITTNMNGAMAILNGAMAIAPYGDS